MFETALIIACALATLAWWIVIPARAARQDRRLGMLSEFSCAEPARWPSVSLLVPASNEETTLAAAAQSLLDLDYPELEIILIDDRSRDRTGEIMARLAARDTRIRVLRVDTLPDGWLGKVHALQRGVEISRGEWLLFTDADIHFSPCALKRAVAWCLQQQRDFLALFPGAMDTGLVVGAAQAAFGTILLSMLDFGRIDDPRSPMAMGVGAFNLARRSFVDRDGGLEWLRMEVADDIGLALMLKRRGARLGVLSGRDLIRFDWYPSLQAMFDGVMQRGIVGANYRLGIYLLQCLLVVFCLLAPLLLGVTLAAHSPLGWLVLAACALPSLILGIGIRNLALPRRLLWALPLGYGVVAFGMLRSFAYCLRHRGIYWRGTVYPLPALRAAQRVKYLSIF